MLFAVRTPNDAGGPESTIDLSEQNAERVGDGNSFLPPNVFKYVYVMEDDDEEDDLDDSVAPTSISTIRRREIISWVTMFVIFFSCICYVIATSPGLMKTPETCDIPACDDDAVYCPGSQICPPEPPAIFDIFEIICVSFFTLDYVCRCVSVPFVPTRIADLIPKRFDKTNILNLPDPQYAWYLQLYKYVTKGMNIVDLVAILPFYISFVSSSGGSVSIVRILRLARILRVFKVGSLKRYLKLIEKTMVKSLPALGLLLFFAALGVVLFASILYFLEHGSFVVNEDFPEGAFVRWNSLHNAKEESPFRSILTACYWAVVTSTTVGYGDLYPTTDAGRALAIVLMYLGILIIALPVGVVGSSFSKEYEKMLAMDKLKQEQEAALATGSGIHSAREPIIKRVEDMIESMNSLLEDLKKEDAELKKRHARRGSGSKDLSATRSPMASMDIVSTSQVLLPRGLPQQVDIYANDNAL